CILHSLLCSSSSTILPHPLRGRVTVEDKTPSSRPPRRASVRYQPKIRQTVAYGVIALCQCNFESRFGSGAEKEEADLRDESRNLADQRRRRLTIEISELRVISNPTRPNHRRTRRGERCGEERRNKLRREEERVMNRNLSERNYLGEREIPTISQFVEIIFA
ncbi:hypothetical protein LINPERPRIM_LOCUS37184, partial [Linum perenne]